jgi:hypothetical protein
MLGGGRGIEYYDYNSMKKLRSDFKRPRQFPWDIIFDSGIVVSEAVVAAVAFQSSYTSTWPGTLTHFFRTVSIYS